jgi:hypothetical protein
MATAINPSPASLMEDISFIQDMARFGEGSMSERRIRKKWGFTDATWDQLGENEDLIEAIELEKERRVRGGQAARDLAAQAFVGAPRVLDTILRDDTAPPRVRIESAKELRQIAVPPQEAAAAAAERFTITIVLNSDVEHYSKSRAIDANDVDPGHVDTAALAAITANKPTDSSSDGEPQPV